MNYQEISTLADQGVFFVGTDRGMTYSNWLDWQNKGTNDKSKLKVWIDEGYNLVAVATRGHQFIIDKDDPAACETKDMPEPFLGPTYTVDTPSGGEHLYGLHDAVTEALGNLIVVHAEKGNKKTKKILELKLNTQSVAAPTAVRLGQKNKCDGIYVPRDHKKLARGLNPAWVAWLKEHAEPVSEYKKTSGTLNDFHPTFTMESFLEANDCTEDKSGMIADALHIVVESCPICGKDAKKTTLAGGVTKFIFGGTNYGFICHGCGINSRAEFEEKMAELHPDWQPWEYFIYREDDDALRCEAFGVEECPPERVNSADTSPKTPYEKKLGTLPPSVSISDTKTRYSDAGNALRLAKACGEDILYCVQADEYYVWDGSRWVRDLNDVFMLRKAKSVTENMFEEAKGLDEESAKALRSHALKSQSAPRLSAMVSLAKLHVKNVNRGDFDKDPLLFNVQNGTIDLRLGTCRTPDRNDLISKRAPVTYDSNAKCPLWDKCLLDWMLGDRERLEYLRRMGGYTLTGCTNEEVMPILHGGGRNGKTKFYATIYNVLGDGEYAKAANFDSFVVKKGDEGMPNDIAGWCGMRLIVAAEGEHSKRLAEAKLKLCTGRDPVVGEFKYQEEFNYIPTYKVWLVSNPKPRIVGTGDAIWDRVHFVEWRRYYRPEERDMHLQEKLDAEASGILKWLIAGCLEWQQRGLDLPTSMQEDTKAYRNEQDVVGRFIDEECVVGEEFASPKKLTYICFKEWAEDAGEHYTMTQVEFNEKMLYKFSEGRNNNGRFWKGLKLKKSESGFEADLASKGMTQDNLLAALQ